MGTALGILWWLLCTQAPTVDGDLQALVEAERSFARTAADKGVKEAFVEYLTEEAIIFRPQPIKGRAWYRDRPATKASLTWEPIFADRSRAGDLGYTTGPYQFRSQGKDDSQVQHGQYVSLWRKDDKGVW